MVTWLLQQPSWSFSSLPSSQSLINRAFCLLETLEVIALQQIRRDITGYRRRKILGSTRVTMSEYLLSKVPKRVSPRFDKTLRSASRSGFLRRTGRNWESDEVHYEAYSPVSHGGLLGDHYSAKAQHGKTHQVVRTGELSNRVTFSLHPQDSNNSALPLASDSTSLARSRSEREDTVSSCYSGLLTSTPSSVMLADSGSRSSLWLEIEHEVLPASPQHITNRFKSRSLEEPMLELPSPHKGRANALSKLSLFTASAKGQPTLGSLLETTPLHRERIRPLTKSELHEQSFKDDVALHSRHKLVSRNRLTIDYLNFADRYTVDPASPGSWRSHNPPQSPTERITQRHGVVYQKILQSKKSFIESFHSGHKKRSREASISRLKFYNRHRKLESSETHSTPLNQMFRTANHHKARSTDGDTFYHPHMSEPSAYSFEELKQFKSSATDDHLSDRDLSPNETLFALDDSLDQTFTTTEPGLSSDARTKSNLESSQFGQMLFCTKRFMHFSLRPLFKNSFLEAIRSWNRHKKLVIGWATWLESPLMPFESSFFRQFDAPAYEQWYLDWRQAMYMTTWKDVLWNAFCHGFLIGTFILGSTIAVHWTTFIQVINAIVDPTIPAGFDTAEAFTILYATMDASLQMLVLLILGAIQIYVLRGVEIATELHVPTSKEISIFRPTAYIKHRCQLAGISFSVLFILTFEVVMSPSRHRMQWANVSLMLAIALFMPSIFTKLPVTVHLWWAMFCGALGVIMVSVFWHDIIQFDIFVLCLVTFCEVLFVAVFVIDRYGYFCCLSHVLTFLIYAIMLLANSFSCVFFIYESKFLERFASMSVEPSRSVYYLSCCTCTN
eukprot:Gregarina_sp_Poly_1__9402@NODE_588_length_7367_cov_108_309726_g454_i0_p1_GENE_NODE_588_length_7367_cov_108_309726_g454_i0NODE_588_length_7367_cov_108_309726_g454_i0_p1_ORF_typecomplete_len841_score69_38_NODE_588_length_7367_cov_108_309726_g454_i044146936